MEASESIRENYPLMRYATQRNENTPVPVPRVLENNEEHTMRTDHCPDQVNVSNLRQANEAGNHSAHEGESPSSLSANKQIRESIQPTDKQIPKVPSWTHLVTDSWFWEIAGMSLSLAAFISIFGVLAALDAKPVPQLPHHITLNAIVSILAAVAKASLITAVSATMSQQKWLWFERDRRLEDFQAYDDASRGPLGALCLLLHGRGSCFAWCGAIILVAAVAIDPFFQQLIVYPLTNVPSSSQGAIVNETLVIPKLGVHSVRLSGLDNSFQNAIRTALYNTNVSARIPPVCPTGDCKWTPYYALSFCSRCEDVSNRISVEGTAYKTTFNESITQILSSFNETFLNEMEYDSTVKLSNNTYAPTVGTLKLTLPKNYATSFHSNGYFANLSYTLTPPTYINRMAAEKTFPYTELWEITVRENYTITDISEMFDPFELQSLANMAAFLNESRLDFAGQVAGPKNPITTFRYTSVKYAADADGGLLNKALECALTFCINEYDTSVTGGTAESSIRSTIYGTYDYTNPSIQNSQTSAWFAEVDGTQYVLSDNTSSKTGFNQLNFIRNSIYDALVGETRGNPDPITILFSLHDRKPVVERILTRPTPNVLSVASSAETQAIQATCNFSQTLENVVMALNNHLQRYATDKVPGVVLVAETHVQIRWAWVVLPLVLLVMGFATLLATIWQTRRRGTVVWKSSSLPLLYHGPVVGSLGTRMLDAHLKNVSAMTVESRRESLRLKRGYGDGVWKLHRTRSVGVER